MARVSDVDRTLRYDELSRRKVGLDELTFMWVHLAKFDIDPHVSDAALLDALVAHRAFRISFGGLDKLGPEKTRPDSSHGPYPLARIHSGLFKLVDPAAADAALFAWANDQDWNPPYTGQSPETLERLRTEVCSLFRRGNVYQMTGLNEADYEDHAFVGWIGFVEFVVIDRNVGELHMVVASDD